MGHSSRMLPTLLCEGGGDGTRPKWECHMQRLQIRTEPRHLQLISTTGLHRNTSETPQKHRNTTETPQRAPLHFSPSNCKCLFSSSRLLSFWGSVAFLFLFICSAILKERKKINKIKYRFSAQSGIQKSSLYPSTMLMLMLFFSQL